jgi:ubiquinone/menaquinone biosynthesis C-methylase UbiE
VSTYIAGDQEIAVKPSDRLYPELPVFERHLKVLELVEGDSLLDVGCFTGSFVREAVRRFPGKNVIGIDYSAEHIGAARALYPDLQNCFHRMSVYDLALDAATIECITVQEVLEHLEGAALAIKELNRVLKPGGLLIITIPNPYYFMHLARFVRRETANAWRASSGATPKLHPEVLSPEVEWDRHIYTWTAGSLLALLAHNGFEYVLHCYENGMPDVFRRSFLKVLPFLGPTLILKVRKVGPAPARLI